MVRVAIIGIGAAVSYKNLLALIVEARNADAEQRRRFSFILFYIDYIFIIFS